MSKIPDRLYIDKTDKELFDSEILNEVFSGKDNKDKFLFAMSIGFRNDLKYTLQSREGYVRAEYLQLNDEALIDSLAIYDSQSVDVISDRERVFKIAEEYARGGIRLLYDKLTSSQPGSYIKKLESELYGILEEEGFLDNS